MILGVSALEAANPGTLVATGEQAISAATTLGSQVTAARKMVTTMADGWNGGASKADVDKAHEHITQHEALQQTLMSAGSTLTSSGAELGDARIALLDYVGQLKSQGWQVADDGAVSVASGSALEQFAKDSPVGAMLVQLQSLKASSEMKTGLAKFTAMDHALAEKLKGFRPDLPESTGPDQPCDPTKHQLTDAEKAEVARWSQFFATNNSDNGGGDCSRWATASALANQYGVRIGPDGQKEINLPDGVQQNLMGGMPLHFPPTKSEINQIARRQGVAPGNEPNGFPGGPDLMTQQLNEIGVPSTAHTGDPAALVDQMTNDLSQGNQAIVNGAFPGSSGHFISVTGLTTGPNGETLYLVNDSNRVSDGNPNGHTIPSPCTRSQLQEFLAARAQYGPPGYSTVEREPHAA